MRCSADTPRFSRGNVPSGASRRARDRGSAIAEFAMVSGLVITLAMGTIQLGLGLFVRNSLISSASEGARLGARADASLDDGVRRTAQLIGTSLSTAYARDVTATTMTTAAGVRVVEVTVTAPLPVFGLLGPSGTMTVRGRAFQEGQ